MTASTLRIPHATPTPSARETELSRPRLFARGAEGARPGDVIALRQRVALRHEDILSALAAQAHAHGLGYPDAP